MAFISRVAMKAPRAPARISLPCNIPGDHQRDQPRAVRGLSRTLVSVHRPCAVHSMTCLLPRLRSRCAVAAFDDESVSLRQVGVAMASIDRATALLSQGDGLMPLLERLQESYQVGGPLRDDGESNLSRQSWRWPV